VTDHRENERAPGAIAPSAFTPLAASGPTTTKARWQPLKIALVSGLALFSFALWFLFTARSVSLDLTPANASVAISGGLRLPLGGRYLLRTGEFELTLRAEGYVPLRTTLAVSDAASQTQRYRLEPLPGLLSFDLDPPDASVRVDEELLGKGPLESIEVAAGEHRLEVSAPRYRSQELPLEVIGRGQSQRVTVSLTPAWAPVTVASEPSGATILVDGEPLGTTPAEIEVLEGERQLLLQLPRYANHLEQLQITAGEPIDMGTVTLRPAEAQLRLSSRPAGANVTVAGEYRGQTPLTLSLTPDRAHTLNLSRPGYQRASRSVTLAPSTEESLEITLTAQLGDVQITVEPAQAEVLVDGRPMGSGSQKLSLPAFEQLIEVRLEGYATFRQRLTPRPGLEQLVTARLQTETAAQRSSLPERFENTLGQALALQRPDAFSMGASRREPGRRANEILRPVTLQRWFYLQTTEVTNAQFRRFQSEHNSGQVQGNSLNGDDQPAVRVSWLDAARFCNWLSEQEGLALFYQISGGQVTGINRASTGYRLPTEAEWEWAARTGSGDLLRFPWGEEFPPNNVTGNYADVSASQITGRFLTPYNDGFAVSAPVGSFSANARGLHDMGGNVAEWVSDYYAIPTATGDAEVDPLGPDSGTDRVIRGASWAHGTVVELRLAFRDYGTDGRDDVGFRVARFALPE
jgi:formylglycine-generating enzyme required for sulfatase activity